MKKTLVMILILFMGLFTYAHATLTNGYVVITKNGSSNPPTTQNGSIFDTGSSSGPGNVGISSIAPGQTLDVNGTLRIIGFSMGGNTTTSITGTGANVFANSPALLTPNLGTPSAIVLTNATGTANNVSVGTASALNSATTIVNVSGATAPSNGQVLTATSSTTATWETPSASGSNYWLLNVAGNVGISTVAGQNVGIGTFNPGQALDVNGTVRAIGFMGSGSLTGGTNYLPSNLGIGKNSPASALDVNGTITTQGFTMNNFGAGAGNVLVSSSVGVGTWMAPSTLGITGGGTPAGGLNAVEYNSPLGTFAGKENVFSFNGTNVGIGTSSATNLFDVRGTLTTQAFQVNANGNVAIGSAIANAQLTVVGSGNDTISGANLGIGTFTTNQLTVNGGVSIDTANGQYVQTIAPAGGMIMSGNMGIGSLTPGWQLDVQGTARLSKTIILSGIVTDSGLTDATVCEDTTVHRLYSGSGTLGICLGTSSMRFKHNIIPLEEGLAEILKLRPVNFFYNNGYGDNGEKLQYGLIAEEVQNVIPGLVAKDKKNIPNSVDLLGIVPILIKAVQQQQNEINIIFGLFILSLIFSIILFLRKLK